MTETFLLVTLATAILTYATRAGGYLVLSRFARIPPRLDAALEAVPAAVMTTLVAPAVFSGSWREALVLGLAAVVGLRAGMLVTVAVAITVAIVLRNA
jgi:uncharacterized membrane protein